MSLGSKSSYNCEFKAKKLTGKGNSSIEWCTLTHQPCKYRPSECPHRRRILNRSLELYLHS